MRILERHLQSKQSAVPDAGGEDGIVAGDIVAVIDGATAKTQTLYDYAGGKLAPGKLAMEILKTFVPLVKPDMTGLDAAVFLNEKIHDYYSIYELLPVVSHNPAERATASIALYNPHQNYVMLAGDCQAVIGGVHYQNLKEIDRVNADARAKELERIIGSGQMTFEQILAMSPDQEPGRRYIMNPPSGADFPGLKNQRMHQNNPNSRYGFFAMDGFADFGLPGFSIVPVPSDTTEIILASDGYAAGLHQQAVENLRDLQTAEHHLASLIRDDPLCFRINKGTKGKGTHLSFDDRAYMRLAR